MFVKYNAFSQFYCIMYVGYQNYYEETLELYT